MTTKLFNFKARWLLVPLVLLTLGSGNVWGADVTGTIAFSNRTGDLAIDDSSVSGSDDQGNTWTVTTVGTTSFTGSSTYYQVGSSKKPATSITFTTTLPSAQTITSMSAKFGGFSGTAGTVTLKVGDNSIGTGSLNASSDVTVSSTDPTKSGTVLTVTVTGISKGVKCYYISYTYSTGGGTTYTVTYNANGGSGTMTDSDSPYSSGATVTVLDNEFTAPSGYVFDHWNTEDDDSGTDYDPDDTFTISANTTLYAQWVESGGGGGTEYVLVTSTEDLEAGANYVIGSADAGDGYFMSTAISTNNRQQTASISISNDHKITSTSEVLVLQLDGSTGAWTFLTTNYLGTDGYLSNAASGTSNRCFVGNTAREFTIAFDGNAAVITATSGSERNILRYNSSNNPPIFACYGSDQNPVYLYKEVPNCDELGSINGSISLSNAGNNVTASGWTATTGGNETGYLVKLYNSDKSSVITSANTVSKDTKTHTFSNPGAGTYWVSVTPTYSGAGDYCSEGTETFSATSIVVSGNVTVTFDATTNGGSISTSTQSVPYNTATALTSWSTLGGSAPSCKQFAHWNTAADDSGQSYNDGANITATGATTLYAIYEDITYAVSDGTMTGVASHSYSSNPITCGTTLTITCAADASHKGNPTVTATGTHGAITVNSATEVTIANVQSAIAVSISYPAKEVYSITWHTYNNDNYTAGGATTSYTEGGSLTLPTDPSPAGGWECADTFVGWSENNIGSDPGQSAPADLFTDAAGAPAIDGNKNFYAIYAKASGGGGSTTWTITALDAVTEGTYALLTTDGYAYNGTISNGHGQVTATAFSFTDGVATSAPDGTRELTFIAESTGFKMYDPTDEVYLYATAAASGKLSTKASDDDYWRLDDGNWKYSWNDAYLRSYNNGSIRTYASASYGDLLKLAKKNTVSYSNYVTTCCTQPKTPLTITADQIELVKSGVVTLTATGGNGTDITWTATGGVLSNQSNTGATLTISDVDATQNITVTATQAENNNDDEVVYCAQEASIDITVKAQWTITFQTNDNGVKNSNSILVTDGESYTMPDISDEYVCNSGSSFAGWVDNEDDTEVDATPNSTQTATADQTWYAAWSSSSTTKSVDIYQLVTNVTNLAAGDEVWITNTTPTVAMGVQNDNNRGQVTVTKHPTESDKIYSTGSPATLTIGKDGTYYTFYDGTIDHTGYLYAASSTKNYLRLQATYNADGKWSITIEDGKATITAQGTNTRNKLKYNSSSSIFSCYEGGQGDVRIYKNVGTAEIEVSGASITTNNTSCHRGAVIFAENGKWITSSKGQKVRIAINVTARGFESDATLSATSANEHFSVVSITNTTITQNSAFETQMMIEYQPAEANTNENAEITLVAKKGEEVVATRTIDVNGRSLPDEFVIVAQYNDKWLAVPANMQSGADQYNGIEVTPNNELTQIPAAPSTTIYSLRGVADNRYEAAGTCVRLVGNGNKCLWGNAASTNTTIQNWTTLGATNGSNYEWLLTTSDGELYTIANPEHPDYDEGRILSNSGSKYGLYKGTTKFYILPVGCSSLPGNIQVTARRVDATFSWETNASTVTIDLYTNEGMTEGHKTASVTDVPYLFSSLAENTQYWYKLTPDADDDCAVTGTFKTTGPVIDVVEWGENSATIYVDKDEAVDPRIIIAGEVEHGQGGIVATDIFFSKYFEAEGTAKLLAIYNGTANAISLADITILQRTSAKNTPLSLASYGKTAGWIQPGEEIVLFNRDSRDAVMECAENNETYDSWINVEDNNLSFSGKGTIRLFRGNTCIDIIGAMNAGDNAANMNDKTRDPMEGAASPSFGDAKGFVTSFGDNYKTPAEETDYELSTNRCLLIRRAFVTSGDSALLNNFGDFKTLGTYTGVDSKTHKGEWSGLRIPTAVPPETDYIHTCAGFEDAGSFDYNKYYKEFSTISDDKYLSDFTRADDGTYTLSIEYMRQYACMNLKFQLTAHNDPTDVLTEQLVQVPIVVKDARNSNDTLFNNIIKQDVEPHAPMVPESINRCKTCNVVVLGTGTLTKVADGSTNDVAEIRDVKVYPGGKLIIPEGTHYVVNSLALRRQEDVVAAAKINSGLADDPDDITDKGIYIRESNGVYLDVRIDPSKWHYFTLPYDCRVGDVRFADGTPAKVNTDYLISWYDGAYRAEHKTGGWTDITSDDYVLKAGLGYIVALPGSGLIKRELRFPMANNVIAEELGDKTVGGLYAYGGDKTDEELRPNHKGWNMIGNPYLYDYTTDIVTDPLAVGELEHDPSGSSWNGKWVRTGSARYIVAPIDDNGWKGYEQTTISNLRPFMSYFIQVGTKTDGTENPETERSITFDKDQKPASIIRRAQAEDAEPMYPVWYGLELLAPNGEKDNTTLLISNEFTDDYDMMDDLIKMRGSYYNYYQNPVLASRNNSGEMAFNALPDSSAAVIGVPLNYYAYQAGTYTFATDSRYDLEEVKSAMLFDATTQQYYDLLTENHSFSLAKGDNNARFKLYVRVERKKPQITTDVDNLLVDGQLSLIALDKTLVLSGLTDAADIYVYDATGKLIRSDLSASGGGIWRTNVPAQGVYFVRVNSTTSQQTLRTVVK